MSTPGPVAVPNMSGQLGAGQQLYKLRPPTPTRIQRSASPSGIQRTKSQGTVPKPFNFELDQRLEDRRHYNEALKKKQRAADERERVSRAQREREEQKRLKEYRKTLDFKANPIRQYPGITLTHSDKGPTLPQGPNLISIGRTRTVPSEHPSSDGGSCNGDSSSSSPHSSTDGKS